VFGAVGGRSLLSASPEKPFPLIPLSLVEANKFQAAWTPSATTNSGGQKLCFTQLFYQKCLFPQLYKNSVPKVHTIIMKYLIYLF
jgi:hypothetical protein